MRTSSSGQSDQPVVTTLLQARRPTTDWRPAGAADALAMAERIARYCAFSCNDGPDGCTEEQCAAWNLERAATAYLAGRWVDAQD